MGIRIAVSFSIIATWPTLLMSAHKCFSSMFALLADKEGKMSSTTSTVVWRVGLAVGSVIIACFRPSLDLVILCNAILTKFPIVFIVPTCLAIALDGGWKKAAKRNIPGIVMMVFGVLGMVAMTATFFM